MGYTKTVWNEKSVPGISGAKLNKIEQGIYEAHERITNMQEIPSGGTSADAALYDINIGFDGTNHESPGESVRAQAQQLDDKINEVSGQLSSEIANVNNGLIELVGEMVSKEEIAEMEQGSFTASGEEKENNTRIRTVNSYTNVTEIVFNQTSDYSVNAYITYFYDGATTVKNQWIPTGNGTTIYAVDETIPYDYIRVYLGISGNEAFTPETFTASLLVKYSEKVNGKIDDINEEMTRVESEIYMPVSENQIARLGWNVYNKSTPPQQTLPSYALAYKNGCRIMLADIRTTADGHLVCLHDTDLGATLGTNYFRKADGTELTEAEKATLIADMTLDSLLALDCGLYKGEKWQGTKVLQVEDFLRWCSQMGCVPMIETKGTITAEQIAYVGELCKKYNCFETVIIAEDVSYWNTRMEYWTNALPNTKYMCVRGGNREFEKCISICNSLKNKDYKAILGYEALGELPTDYETIRNANIYTWFSEIQTNNIDSMYDNGYLDMMDFVSSSYLNIAQYKINRLLG